jgi:phage/plasmid-associated DNA primase
MTLEHFAIFTGCGRNGKDVLGGLLEHTLGDDNYLSPDSKVLTQESKGEINQEMANCNEKRAVVVNEPSAKIQLKCAVIKKLSGGGITSARGIYQSGTKVILQMTLMLLCNAIPDIDTIDDALRERLIIVLFPSLFRSAQRMEAMKASGMDMTNVHLLDTKYKTQRWIKDSRKYMLRLMLDGLSDLYARNGSFTIANIPAHMMHRNEEYVRETDDFYGWFSEVFVKEEGAYLSMATIHEEYKGSDYFTALGKRQQRRCTKKSMRNDVTLSPTLKPFYRERFRRKGVDRTNVVVGWTRKTLRGPAAAGAPEDSDSDSDSEQDPEEE